MQVKGHDPPLWLARTKLRPPLLGPDIVARPRLLETLRSAALSSRLTLLSAPAGYGKTVLLASLPRAFPDLPLAWLSLDREDGDLARFLVAVVHSLRHPFPGFGGSTLALLEAPAGSGVEPRHLAAALVNDLLQAVEGPTLMVMDDLHLVSEPAVCLLLDYLLERLPPQIHLLASARQDPPLALARLLDATSPAYPSM